MKTDSGIMTKKSKMIILCIAIILIVFITDFAFIYLMTGVVDFYNSLKVGGITCIALMLAYFLGRLIGWANE